MKRIVSSPDSAEVELIRNMLADGGVLCEVRNADVSGIVPAPSFYEELWVADEDFARATELLASLQRLPASADAWTCPRCGERIEPQFVACWKCGAERPMLASA